MSTREAVVASGVATALLAGPWSRPEMLVRMRSALGVRSAPRWVGPLITQVLAAYRDPPADRPRELAAFVQAQPAWATAWRRTAVSPGIRFGPPYIGATTVIRFDIESFYASINAGRVWGVLRSAGLPESVAHTLTGLVTTVVPRSVLRGLPLSASVDADRRQAERYARPHLPQGAPTSPALANLVAFRLDCRLAGLASRFGLTAWVEAPISGDSIVVQSWIACGSHRAGLDDQNGRRCCGLHAVWSSCS
jgi:hypothetical protein